jgi:hypothetical protein
LVAVAVLPLSSSSSLLSQFEYFRIFYTRQDLLVPIILAVLLAVLFE